MKKDVKTGIIVLIILIIVVIGVSVGSIFSTHQNQDSIKIKSKSDVTNYDPKIAKEYKKDYVAAVHIEGTIESANQTYNQKWLLDTISTLKDDDRNEGMIVYINSPGGAVYQADEIYLALQDYKTTGKKIYIYMGPMAASGGYYIACAGNKIYANRNTLTGSIGVIAGQSVDMSEFLSKMGIKATTIHAGKNKTMGSISEPLTEEQKAIMQSIADECYDQFCGIVATQRDLPIEKVHSLADGRIYTANQALSHGLIDSVDSWENMLKDFTESELEKPGIKVITLKKEKKQKFVDYMMDTISNFEQTQAAAKLGIPASLLKDMESFNSYPAYLYK